MEEAWQLQGTFKLNNNLTVQNYQITMQAS
jgi:hypothetical protein